MSHELTFDLETIPDPSRLEEVNELEEAGILDPIPDLPDRTDSDSLERPEEFLSDSIDLINERLQALLPANLYLAELEATEKKSKKPRKGIFEAIEKVRKRIGERDSALASRSLIMGTCPELCRICAVGFARDDSEPKGFIADTEDLEKEIIEILWGELKNARPVIGFNILAFDLPVLLARSVFLDVAPSRSFSNVKPWEDTVIDVYLKRFGSRGNTDRKKPGTLKKLAKLYGIEVPAGDFEGSQVAEAMKTPKGQKELRKYVKSDVAITRELFKKWEGYFL